MRKRLFTPLGLNDTYCDTDEIFPQDQLARAYMHVEENSGQWDVGDAGEPIDGVWDATDWFPLSGAGAAGDMVSTARDLTHWIDCLFSGKVLGQKAFDEMANNLQPASFPGSYLIQNGHGILVSDTDGLIVKGHLGQIPGHATAMGTMKKAASAPRSSRTPPPVTSNHSTSTVFMNPLPGYFAWPQRS